MKRTLFFTAAILLFAFLQVALTPLPAVLAQTPTPPDPVSLEPAALELLDLLKNGQFEQALQRFDPSLVKPETQSQIEQAMLGLSQQVGAFQKITETTALREAGYNVVYITTQFEKGAIDLRIVFNPAGQVVGLNFAPGGTGKTAAQPYRPASYTKTDSFSERQVTVGSGEWALPGLLTLPNGPGPFPAVVLVHGSGPNDRDETIFTNKPFRDLAEGLATQGIAVLRYDKRTKVYGQQMAEAIDKITVKEEVTDDALAALDQLRRTPEVDPERIFLLGHSLGGLLAPQIAAQAPDLAGVIILAAPTRPLEDIVVDQVSYLAQLDGTTSPVEQAQIDLLKEQAARVKDPQLALDTPPAQLPLGQSAAYWQSLRALNPVQTAASLAMPLLILRGERDYQVTQADFDGWKAALGEKAGVFLKQYPDLNHLFIRGSGPPNPQEYQKPGHVSELVIDDIASFIQTGQVSLKVPLIGGAMDTQEITRLVLLLLPILLIQLAVSIYALVDLIKRKKTHGPRWLWAALLVITLFALPTGLIVAAVYLVWGRKEEEEDDGSDDSD